jgi:polyphosphate kinase 2 (PPK2 family)
MRIIRNASVNERIKMKINITDFLVSEGKKVDLEKWPTKVKPVYHSKEKYKSLLDKQREELSDQQQLHYASNRYAMLLIFQAMDAAGKDGAIKHVMSGVNPQGCQVFSFKQPSAEENMISCGAPRSPCRNADESAFSTDPIMRRC